MRFILTAEKIPGLSPARLKKISAVLAKRLTQKGISSAHIVALSLAKMKTLNNDWRGKNKATNVLSYPQFEEKELPKHLKKSSATAPLYLGDIVLCLPYIASEAKKLNKNLNHHLTHLVVHGVLHLLGYDHIVPRKADLMEKLETTLLADLGLPDPYATTPGKRAAR